MGKFILKRKTYSKYDDTDNLKRMKDSDILAEQKKKRVGFGGVLNKMAVGLGAGALAGAAVSGFRKGGFNADSLKRGMKTGAALGGIAMGLGALDQRDKQNDNIDFYNRRLNYAQRQTKRREKADWHANMTQRDGYSY